MHLVADRNRFLCRQHSSDASDLSCLWYSRLQRNTGQRAVVLERNLAVPHIKLIEVWGRYLIDRQTVRSVKYEENQRCTEDDTPYEVNMRWSSTWWSTVSKAALKSRKALSASCPMSIALVRSARTFMSAVSVECNFLYADWNFGRRLFAARYLVIWLWTTRSRTFDRNVRFETAHQTAFLSFVFLSRVILSRWNTPSQRVGGIGKDMRPEGCLGYPEKFLYQKEQYSSFPTDRWLSSSLVYHNSPLPVISTPPLTLYSFIFRFLVSFEILLNFYIHQKNLAVFIAFSRDPLPRHDRFYIKMAVCWWLDDRSRKWKLPEWKCH